MNQNFFAISKNLVEKGIITEDFFPTNEEHAKECFVFFSNQYSAYLSQSIEKINTHRRFDLLHANFDFKPTLVIEIGGTKATIQILSMVNDNVEHSEHITVETLRTETNMVFEDFCSWLEKLIRENIGNTERVGINLAGAVNTDGVILLSPPNISVEDMSGKNIVERLHSSLPNLQINIFNDTESVLGAQYFNERKDKYNLYANINGTGSNSSFLDSSGYMHNLETGHAPATVFGGITIELEDITGGRKGIEQNFNKIINDKNLSDKHFTTLEIYDLSFNDYKNEDIYNVALLTYNRAYFYKAMSFIVTRDFCHQRNMVSDKPDLFLLFGGINKSMMTIPSVKSWLKFFGRELEIRYTVFGEDAGRYGAYLLSNVK